MGGRSRIGLVVSLVVSAGLLIGGCLPQFENPVDKSKAQQVDKQMLGCWWRTLESGEVQQVSFLPRAQSKMLDVVFAFGVNNPRARSGAGVNTYEAFSVDLGGDYLCLHQRSGSWRRRGENVQEEAEPYWLVNYELREDGKLEVRMLDIEKFKGLIREDELAGTIEEANGQGRRRWDTVKVTASTDELTAFLEKTPVEDLVTENDDLILVFGRDVEF